MLMTVCVRICVWLLIFCQYRAVRSLRQEVQDVQAALAAATGAAESTQEQAASGAARVAGLERELEAARAQAEKKSLVAAEAAEQQTATEIGAVKSQMDIAVKSLQLELEAESASASSAEAQAQEVQATLTEKESLIGSQRDEILRLEKEHKEAQQQHNAAIQAKEKQFDDERAAIQSAGSAEQREAAAVAAAKAKQVCRTIPSWYRTKATTNSSHRHLFGSACGFMFCALLLLAADI